MLNFQSCIGKESGWLCVQYNRFIVIRYTYIHLFVLVCELFVVHYIYTFMSPTEHSTSIEDVDAFIDALKQKVVSMCLRRLPASGQLLNMYLCLQLSLHTTSLLRCLVESTLRGQPNLRCLEFPSFFAGGFIQ